MRRSTISTTTPTTSTPGFKCVTMNVRVIHRILSLLQWGKDPICQVVVSQSGMRVHMTDAGKSTHATALIRDELFSDIRCNDGTGKKGNVYFGVNLTHLSHALGMLGPGPQLVPLTLQYPGSDGSLNIEVNDSDHSTTCSLSARPWDGEILDLEFSKHDVVVKAALKADLLKDVISDCEQLGADTMDICFSKERQSITFSGGCKGIGLASVEILVHPSNQLVQSIEVKSDGKTTLSINHLSLTIKTDYFKDPTKVGTDHVTLRINKRGTVCMLYHIKSHEVSATCGVECNILPIFEEDDDVEMLLPS
eukprot:TRINITY_DN5307_c0_g1_i1.p1 TRINITY_DN5307_c0_g1~~TRINITY_DN5307_c0_g1_i1.p1  ORF type:complete len:326 (+),score=53.78 TRINITY_DN5307_c0_g1_i1:60-980(+)